MKYVSDIFISFIIFVAIVFGSFQIHFLIVYSNECCWFFYIYIVVSHLTTPPFFLTFSRLCFSSLLILTECISVWCEMSYKITVNFLTISGSLIIVVHPHITHTAAAPSQTFLQSSFCFPALFMLDQCLYFKKKKKKHHSVSCTSASLDDLLHCYITRMTIFFVNFSIMDHKDSSPTPGMS